MVARSRLLTLSRCTLDVLRNIDSGVPKPCSRMVASCTVPGVLKNASSHSETATAGAVAAALTAALVAAGVTTAGAVALCDGETPLHRLQLDALRQWLSHSGSDVSAITFESTEDRGHGIVASKSMPAKFGGNMVTRLLTRLNPFHKPVVATFSDRTIINAVTIQEDAMLGHVLTKHLDRDNITAEEAVKLWLIFHRAMGPHSPYAPYFQTLPSTVPTPVLYSPDQEEELAGTSLLSAARARRRKLLESWNDLQPVVKEMQLESYRMPMLQSVRFTERDWLWASATYTSRVVGLPVSEHELDNTFDSLIPGWDMLNHSKSSNCFWQLKGSLRDSTAEVQVRARRNVPPGAELTIQYTQDSNETMLFRYGFVVENNEADAVMLHCPLGPQAEWDESMHSKVKLLRAKKMMPRFKLPRQVARGVDPLPEEGRRVLETLVMTPEETAQLVKDGEEFDTSKLPKHQRLSIDMAVYTSYVQLLSLHLHSLEGPSGTGTLDQDIDLIAKGPAEMSADKWNCVVYRAGQKRIVREHLKLANERMQAVTAEMKAFLKQAS